MIRPVIAATLVFGCFVSDALAQRNAPSISPGSSEEYRMSRDMAIRAAKAQASWDAAKKITRLKVLPKSPESEYQKVTELGEGWIGYLSAIEFTVLSVKGESAMLLYSNDGVVWLSDFPTKDFVTDQKVRVVGPVKALGTKSYTTQAGSDRTVREFVLLKDSELEKRLSDDKAKLEKELKSRQEEADLTHRRGAVAVLFREIIWGDVPPIAVSKMTKPQLKQYKGELERMERLIKNSVITAVLKTPVAYDSRKKKLEFDCEESRTIAQNYLESLSADLPK